MIKLVATLGLFIAVGCCPAPKKPELPYWIDGIANATSRMADKNIYWLKKIDSGKTTREEERRLIRSNLRYLVGLQAYIAVQKENFERENQDVDEE